MKYIIIMFYLPLLNYIRSYYHTHTLYSYIALYIELQRLIDLLKISTKSFNPTRHSIVAVVVLHAIYQS